MKKLILTSLIVLGAFVSCTPKEGATTPETTPEPAANNETATNNVTATDPAPEATGKATPEEGEGK
ncbi:hypothetical protein KKD52_18125 [Myxococcota bacterium]|jgi:hypothetical protein|nr:hypothetical protein [Myxococcota bacterium]MBU1412032.1 hypothetical protein [Myxococcota bacterium]MBU1512272.1 hypothetical protein [Myxococcota bacterium]PKN25384.1 MAG: hypothetical protein CVU65_08955 [Deltaproteobacteria bacterium HGW-Deltaproteobacteria-22]